jgi:hypothetical protein
MKLEYQLEIAKTRRVIQGASREQLIELYLNLLKLNYAMRETVAELARQEFTPK